MSDWGHSIAHSHTCRPKRAHTHMRRHTHWKLFSEAFSDETTHEHKLHNASAADIPQLLLSSSSASCFLLLVLANQRRLASVRTSVCSTGNTSLCCKAAQTTANSQSKRTDSSSEPSVRRNAFCHLLEMPGEQKRKVCDEVKWTSDLQRAVKLKVAPLLVKAIEKRKNFPSTKETQGDLDRSRLPTIAGIHAKLMSYQCLFCDITKGGDAKLRILTQVKEVRDDGTLMDRVIAKQ